MILQSPTSQCFHHLSFNKTDHHQGLLFIIDVYFVGEGISGI